ncbi:mucin-associated surface protein (MASP), putative, partial [Trypanosoma cruzi]
LPSTSRTCDGARVVVVVGTSVVVVLGACVVVVVDVVVGGFVVVVVVVVGAFVVVVVVVVWEEASALGGSFAAHMDEQQHRASSNRAHSTRHVIIIVSVVVQWCGADLHSEGHEEQQGRREVQQTHTVGTPHEERAAARHTPYAAHHARHTLQSTATGTHTHSPAATPTNRWKREKQTGAAHKAPPHAHTARAVRRVGTPHGGYTHTQEEAQRTQQHKGNN